MVFLKIGKGLLYANTNGSIDGIKKDLNAKYLKVDGSFHPLWNVAPTAIRILEYILDNPNSAVVNICRTLHFANPQQVNTVLAYFKDAERCHLIYEGPEQHRFSVLKEKEKEIREFVRNVRENKMEANKLEVIE